MTAISAAPVTKADARRRQILDAASACVRQAGFHGASMAEIAQAAGLSVGQIYRYFENKEAIIAAIVEADLAEMHERFVDLETSGAPLVSTFIDHSVKECTVPRYGADRAALALEVLAEAGRNPRILKVAEAAYAGQRALLRRLLDEACPDDCGETEKTARAEALCMIFDGLIVGGLVSPAADRAAFAPILRAMLELLLSKASLGPAEPASL
jgi:AcrR family transcriptional regulator